MPDLERHAFSSNVLYPKALFKKSATGCKVHNYSDPLVQFVENNTLAQFVENNTLAQFVENNTLAQFVENNTLTQFVENNTLDQIDGNYTGFILCFHMGYNCMIPLHGVSKQLRQRKLTRSKRSFSEVLTTCKMSRGWKLLSELRNSGLAGRVALATMA